MSAPRHFSRISVILVFVACLLSAVFAPCAFAKLSDIGSSSNKNAIETTIKPTIAEAIKDVEESAKDTAGTTQAVLKTTVAEMVSAAAGLNGRYVSFAGEAVGGVIAADGSNVWVNIGGRDSLIGVYMTKEQASQIEYQGAYNVKGSEMEIKGTLNTSCAEHDGELDVHAAEVSVVSPGGEVEKALSTKKFALAAALLVAGACLYLLYYRRKQAAR